MAWLGLAWRLVRGWHGLGFGYYAGFPLLRFIGDSGLKRDANLSSVEQVAMGGSSFGALYEPAERIAAIVVENFPALGRLAAMRFVEWVQGNPEGVISLPTGKTPEHFIKWVRRVLEGWETEEVQRLLRESGVDPSIKPEMGGAAFRADR